MAVDKKEFAALLAYDGAWEGDRCKDARNDDGDIIAAAIAISLLVKLRSAAKAKLLAPKDIQIVINSFMDASGMVETETAMGGVVFNRK